MNFRITIAIAISLLSTLTASAQEVKILARYVVSDARINKMDATRTYLDNGAYFAVYTVSGKKTAYMSSLMTKSKSESYGAIYNIEKTDIPETDKDYQKQKVTFKWSFSNTYDKEKGTADVTLVISNKPMGKAFEMTILTEKLDLLVYKGYIEGSLTDIN